MTATTVREPVSRTIARSIYRTGIGLRCSLAVRRGPGGDQPRVFYAGGRAGDIGGPRVKLQRLTQAFPEHTNNFNLVYILSNAPHLPTFALNRLNRRRVPIVHNQNGVFYRAWFDGDWRARNADMARSYHRADYVFWQSAFCRHAADHFLGPRAGPGEILFNAVDTEHFKPSAKSPSKKPFRFLATGKIDGHLFYRLDATLRGLAAARGAGLDCHLTIAGWLSTDAAQATNDLIRDLNLAGNVDLTGPYTQADAPRIYTAADAYITMKHNDPCPNAVIEAMACGLPVVHSATGGIPELVGNDAGAGVVCAPSWHRPHWPDAKSIAEAMAAVAEDHAAMGNAARSRAVAMFDLDDWLTRHRQVFQSLL